MEKRFCLPGNSDENMNLEEKEKKRCSPPGKFDENMNLKNKRSCPPQKSDEENKFSTLQL